MSEKKMKVLVVLSLLVSVTAFTCIKPSQGNYGSDSINKLKRFPQCYRSNVVRYGATLTAVTVTAELNNLIEERDLDGVVTFLKRAEYKSIPAKMAAKILTAVATLDNQVVEDETWVEDPNTLSIDKRANGNQVIHDPIGGGEYESSRLGSPIVSDINRNRMVTPVQELRLFECYKQLKEKCDFFSAPYNKDNRRAECGGLFGSVSMNDLKLPYTYGCTIEQLQTFTKLPLNAFSPNPTFSRLFYLGGAAACLLEVLVSRAAGISPQPLFVATFAAAFADQALGGGASEKILWTLFPQMPDRVLKHEAGHLLVAHLLGCPVQSVALGAWDALTKEQNGDGSGLTGAGTSFFDPELNDSSRKGRVTRSVVDRFSIVVMAGIAAEALCFGAAEGGSDDENTLVKFLSQTVQSNVNIPEQARWAATNALILLRDNQDAYNRLVDVLKKNGSGDIGKIMLAIEGCAV